MTIISTTPLLFGAMAIAAAAFSIPGARAEPGPRISGPHVHDNLAVYFVHGTSAPGPVPLTLQEALEKGSVTVTETKSVNELKIENTGLDDVFIQAGDIVKGGAQDRVLQVSLVLPAKSGQVPIASFCVEQGRWSPRGREDASKFSSSLDAMPSRAAKLAMLEPAKPAAATPPAGLTNDNVTGGLATSQRRATIAGDDIGTRQQKVWREVATTQNKLSANVMAPVAAPQSATSLQLALENENVRAARKGYLAALADKARAEPDVIGYVVAVNGRINSADTYPSNGLFLKMWPKLLSSSVTEAIGEGKTEGAASGSATSAAPPSTESVIAFLTNAETGEREEKTIAAFVSRETRKAKESLFTTAKRGDGSWVHRNYLAY